MADHDPSPFRDSSFYDQETDQIADIDFIMASQENGMAIMTTDVDSIACHSSKLEDIFDAVACSDITANFDCIINPETFVSKSPMTIKCAPRSERAGFHPDYRNNRRNVIPLNYFPNVRFCRFQKCNLTLYLNLYMLRTGGIHGKRLDRWELAVICCALNTVRQYYSSLASWINITEGQKVDLARAFKYWAPFIVKSGPTQEQKMLKNRVNGLSGISAALLPWLFMDALRSIAGPTSDWLTDYTDPLMHRNRTLTQKPPVGDFQLEAKYILRDVFFSAQAVGFKSEWSTIAEDVHIQRGDAPPPLMDTVSTGDIPNLCQLINGRILQARRTALNAFFRPITARGDTRHFYTMDVGVSFMPIERDTTFVFDGFGINNLVKNQMKVKYGEFYPHSDEDLMTAAERKEVSEINHDPYDAEEYSWDVGIEDDIEPEESSVDASLVHLEDQNNHELIQDDGTQDISRIRGGGDVETQQEGLNALLAMYDAQLADNDQVTMIEEDQANEEPEQQELDVLEAVEDRQRPHRIQYPLFGTTGAFGNAQQVKNYIQPKYEEDSAYSGLPYKHYVSPYIPTGGKTAITGMKTYMDSSRTMFQRWTHQATHAKLKYLGIQISNFLKTTAQCIDKESKMSKELSDLIRSLDGIYESFLNDFRTQDRCSVRCEYTYMGTDRQLGSDFDTVVSDELCPITNILQVKHSQLYQVSKIIYQQNVRPLVRLGNMSIEDIVRIYTPAMKTAMVARGEAAAHFLQCGGIVQGSLHNRVLSECSTLFWQVPTIYHVELSREQKAVSLLEFGVQPGLIPLLSDQFLSSNPNSCLYRMDASLITNVSRNATELIRSRDELLETLFLAVPNISRNEIGSMDSLPILEIVLQSEDALTRVVQKTASLIYRTYNYEWQTILQLKKRSFILDLCQGSIDALSVESNGYVFNGGDDRFNTRAPIKTRALVVTNSGM
jgi:hypothetical protein